MYTTEISLENFKRFSNSKINLESNITLLLGPNSSGKSSVIKALLGLKQTASPANEHEVFSAQGEYVDLGVYRDYVLNHDLNKKIKIGLKVSHSLNPFGDGQKRPLQVTFCFGHDSGTEQARLVEILVQDTHINGEVLISLVKKRTRESFLLTLSETFATQTADELWGGRKSGSKPHIAAWIKGLSVKVGDRYQFSLDIPAGSKKQAPKDFFESFPLQILSKLVDSILRGLDRDFFYLGPLRRSPARSYSRTAHLLSVGAAGEHTPSVLANLKARASKERTKERAQSKRLEQLNSWVANVFPGCRIDSKTVEELVKLEIERDGGEHEVISDVGFGFSQVLPILVQAAVMPEETTLLIEQPELHLHPRAQTKLAEVIIEASNSGRRFIIETHSEHFIRGLQLAVSNYSAKKSSISLRLKPSDVRFIYIPRAPQKPTEMSLDEWGDFLTEWPSGFFDEGYSSTIKLLQNKMAGLEKKNSESPRSRIQIDGAGSASK
jgi:predicted ATPase